MYLFIITVFIAELIITLTLITTMVRADKKVVEINTMVLTGKNSVAVILSELKTTITNLKMSVNSLIELVKKKRREYTFKLVQSVILYALMIFCKGKYKKAAIIFQLIVAISDYMQDSKV